MKKVLILFVVVVLIIIGYVLYQNLSEDEKVLQEEEVLLEEDQIEQTKNVFDLLQGKWRADDDINSVIEFRDGEKIDYYSDQIMFEGVFEIDETEEHITVSEGEDVFEYGIVELSEQSLSLMYLPRGNILKYEKIEE